MSRFKIPVLFFLCMLASAVALTLAIANPVHATETAEVNSFLVNYTVYVSIKNPSQDTIYVNIIDYLTGNTINSTTLTDATALIPFNCSGYSRVKVTVSQNSTLNTIHVDVYTITTVLDTGFKDMLNDAFEGNLSVVGIIILLGFGLACISIGRYAGVPIILLVVSVLALYSYIPSWGFYIVVLVAVFVFAKAIHNLFVGG